MKSKKNWSIDNMIQCAEAVILPISSLVCLTGGETVEKAQDKVEVD